jgi:dihydropteroate synthase
MRINNRLHTLTQNKPLIMGILNLTPDSFYGDGVLNENVIQSSLDRFEWADIIDIGAESSRPGATPISSTVEIERLKIGLPLVRKRFSSLISVDTCKPSCAEFALAHGADIINDISGGECTDLLEAVARTNAGIILMHKQGDPLTMQHRPNYTNVVTDVLNNLHKKVKKARSLGISTIIVDPGIGFGKTLQHNLELLKHLNQFKALECPILIGTSNKSFIGQLCDANTQDRLPGSIASVIASYNNGARIFRVHNVKETHQAMAVYRAIYE